VEILLGVLGCAIGGVVRHLGMTAITQALGERFPWATIGVNSVGSALIGGIFGTGIEITAMGFFCLGFSGGLTTFSTFSLQNLGLLSQGRRGAVVWNSILSTGLCLLAAVGSYIYFGGLAA
jgi:CrcB protein